MQYDGIVIAPVTAASLFGSISDFRGSYTAGVPCVFIDHFGVTYSALFTGVIDERSILNMWDAAENEYHIPVSLAIL